MSRGFKVVDKRRFTEEGDEREGSEAVEEVSAAPRPSAPQPSAPQPSGAQPSGAQPSGAQPSGPQEEAAATPAPQEGAPEGAAEEDVAEGGLTFDVFIQSLAQQAMMQLGLIPWPHTGQRGLQIEQARDTIDVMDLLQKKTKGNLNEQEQNLMTTVLYELRMTYLDHFFAKAKIAS